MVWFWRSDWPRIPALASSTRVHPQNIPTEVGVFIFPEVIPPYAPSDVLGPFRAEQMIPLS